MAIDLETTSARPEEARIVELACVKRFPGDMSYERPISPLREECLSTFVNPGIPIPAVTTAIHGIGDADVLEAPPFADIAGRVLEYITGCDLVGYNLRRYDLPVLAREFYRVGLSLDLTEVAIVDSYAVFAKYEPRDLGAAFTRYCPGGKYPEGRQGRHGAEADARASLAVLMGQVAKHKDLPNSPNEISRALGFDFIDLEGKFRRREDGTVEATFGKYKGAALSTIVATDPGWLRWIANNDGFLHDTRAFARAAVKVR